jgi:hypothetical protein
VGAGVCAPARIMSKSRTTNQHGDTENGFRINIPDVSEPNYRRRAD